MCTVNVFCHCTIYRFTLLMLPFDEYFLILGKSNVSIFSFLVNAFFLFSLQEAFAYSKVMKILFFDF